MPNRVGSCLGCGMNCCTRLGLPWTPYTQVIGNRLVSRLPLRSFSLEQIDQQNWPDYQNWLQLHSIDSYWEGPSWPPTRDSVLVVSAPKDGLLLTPDNQVVPQVFGDSRRHAIVLLEQSCKHLQPDGSCGIFGQPQRPQICAEWPSQPWELQTLTPAGQAACGYSFVN